jgi:hypothetical protein
MSPNTSEAAVLSTTVLLANFLDSEPYEIEQY